jgi:hypothetical protein
LNQCRNTKLVVLACQLAIAGILVADYTANRNPARNPPMT